MSTLSEEISRRRTFAIISHPDAGKTTLTEKFLLYGGGNGQPGRATGRGRGEESGGGGTLKKKKTLLFTATRCLLLPTTAIQGGANLRISNFCIAR